MKHVTASGKCIKHSLQHIVPKKVLLILENGISAAVVFCLIKLQTQAWKKKNYFFEKMLNSVWRGTQPQGRKRLDSQRNNKKKKWIEEYEMIEYKKKLSTKSYGI